MKFIKGLSLVFSGLLAVNVCMAAVSSTHQKPENSKSYVKSTKQSACGITVINNNYYPVAIYGRYDDSSEMQSFILGAYGDSKFIPLYNYAYQRCDFGLSLLVADVECSPNDPNCIIISTYAYQGRPFYVPVDPYASKNSQKK